MGQEKSYLYSWPPVGASLNVQREDPWRHFDNSINAVSFGFVATAILISMFLVMAIFERFLRPNSSLAARNHGDLESQLSFNGKLSHPSPKKGILGVVLPMLLGLGWKYRIQMTIYTSGVSVLMPGDEIPTFIAHPAPVPSPPDPRTLFIAST